MFNQKFLPHLSNYIINFWYFNYISICYFLKVVTRNAPVSVSIRNFPFEILKFRIYSYSWIHEMCLKLQFQTKNKLFEVFVKVSCSLKYMFYIYIITLFICIYFIHSKCMNFSIIQSKSLYLIKNEMSHLTQSQK